MLRLISKTYFVEACTVIPLSFLLALAILGYGSILLYFGMLLLFSVRYQILGYWYRFNMATGETMTEQKFMEELTHFFEKRGNMICFFYIRDEVRTAKLRWKTKTPVNKFVMKLAVFWAILNMMANPGWHNKLGVIRKGGPIMDIVEAEEIVRRGDIWN